MFFLVDDVCEKADRRNWCQQRVLNPKSSLRILPSKDFEHGTSTDRYTIFSKKTGYFRPKSSLKKTSYKLVVRIIATIKHFSVAQIFKRVETRACPVKGMKKKNTVQECYLFFLVSGLLRVILQPIEGRIQRVREKQKVQ